MMLVDVTSVPSTALPIAVLAEHLRLSSGFADDGSQDAVLEQALRSALSVIEAQIAKAAFTRDFKLTVTDWTEMDRHPLPVAPAISVQSLSVIERDGTRTDLDGAGFFILPDAQTPYLVARDGVLPDPGPDGAAEVVFSAGMGATWTDLPANLQQAVLTFAASLYEKGAIADGEMPQSVAALLAPFRPVRLSGRGLGTRP